MTNPLSTPQSNDVILKKPNIKRIGTLKDFILKKMKIISVKILLEFLLQQDYQHLKYYNQ